MPPRSLRRGAGLACGLGSLASRASRATLTTRLEASRSRCCSGYARRTPGSTGFVFTLPFVLASDIGAFLPVVMALISMAFFGLDQVAAELEGPFGVEPNDIPLLHKGLEFVDDCDVMVSAAQHQIDEHRSEETSEGPNAAEAGGGQAGTGEASVVACGTSEEPLEDGLTEVEQDVPVAMDGGITDG
jgi:hypothetical protein